MESKGLTATQLITALAVGLLIIGILAYLIITWTGKGGEGLTEAECKAKAFGLCSTWALTDYDPENAPAGLADFNLGDCSQYLTLSSAYCEGLL
jgi:hypothetical protein